MLLIIFLLKKKVNYLPPLSQFIKSVAKTTGKQTPNHTKSPRTPQVTTLTLKSIPWFTSPVPSGCKEAMLFQQKDFELDAKVDPTLSCVELEKRANSKADDYSGNSAFINYTGRKRYF